MHADKCMVIKYNFVTLVLTCKDFYPPKCGLGQIVTMETGSLYNKGTFSDFTKTRLGPLAGVVTRGCPGNVSRYIANRIIIYLLCLIS